MNFNDECYDNSEDICNIFVNYFSSVYISPNSTTAFHQTNINQNSHINLSSLTISLAEVFEGHSKLSVDKTYGPDQLPPIILFQCHYALAYPLYLLFNKSLSDGVSHIPGNQVLCYKFLNQTIKLL